MMKKQRCVNILFFVLAITIVSTCDAGERRGVISLNRSIITVPTYLAEDCRGKIILGKSKIFVPNSVVVGTQVDRVIRDIAWKKSRFDENVDPSRIPKKEQLVPYMEGMLSGVLMDYAKVKIIGLTPAVAIKRGDFYYADDGAGNYIFRICSSKVAYKTASFLSGEKRGVFVDTHGFNMIAGAAIRLNRVSRLHLVIACLDLPAKAQAAFYLAKNGINCYGPCDRFAYQLLGYKEKHSNTATIMGTAPIRRFLDGAVIGDQSIEIFMDEVIIIQNTDKGYPDQYCDTPTRYFDQLNKMYELGLKLVKVNANAGEAQKVVEEAILSKASVIGVRIWNKNDANAVAEWLGDNSNHRAVLFHSAPYKPGYEMFFRFPKQTSFGDLSPIIKRINKKNQNRKSQKEG
ncbi:MAG: hypothetical protein K9M15_01530 [Candidatus Marinimicrobia bacterium]|nr:hypothetical protein [Candidatus Neomarinimicrobiota bacterium]